MKLKAIVIFAVMLALASVFASARFDEIQITGPH